jgi:branched-subunit amino acid transport protein
MSHFSIKKLIPLVMKKRIVPPSVVFRLFSLEGKHVFHILAPDLLMKEKGADLMVTSLLLIKLAIVACLFVFCHSAISAVHSTVLQSQPSNPAHQFSACRKKSNHGCLGIEPWIY